MAQNFDDLANETTNMGGRGVITQDGPNGELEAPKNIITTPGFARSIYYIYRNDNIQRNYLWAQIEGMIGGNPPFDPADLEAHGLQHITNFNNQTPRARYERSALAYWNLLYGVEYLGKFTLGRNSPEELKICQILAKNYDYVIKQWPNFKTVFNTLISQLVKFGLSPVIWQDERDWQFMAVDISKLYLANEASTNTHLLSYVCIESTYTAQFLFQVYIEAKKKEKKKEPFPWSIDELEYLLLYYGNVNRNQKDRFLNFMDLQTAYQNGSFFWDTDFETGINTVSIFVREYDGKISHVMIDRDNDNGGLLYFSDRQYQRFEDLAIIFTASPGETTYYSNRGVGHKIFSSSIASMQLDCAVVDGAKWASTVFLRSTANASRDAEGIRFYQGAPTHIGMNEIQLTNIGTNLPGIVQVASYIDGKMDFNAQNSGDDPGMPDKDKISMSQNQAALQSFKESGIPKNNIAHFYSFMDEVHRNMFGRLIRSKEGCPNYEYFEEFKARCIEDGIPEQILDNILNTSKSNLSFIDKRMPKGLDLKAARVAGDGSTMSIIMASQGLGPYAGALSTEGQRTHLELYVRALYGEEYVPSLLQGLGSPDENGSGASVATLENAIMRMGESPQETPDNDHKVHITVHFGLGNMIIQAAKQGQLDVVAADKQFTVLIPHMEEHIQDYAKSPYAQMFLEQIKKPWEELKKYAILNHNNAVKSQEAKQKEQQQAQEQQQQVMSKEQLAAFKVQSEEQRKDAQAAAKEQRSAQQSEARAEIQKTSIEKAAENQRYKIELEGKNRSKEVDLKHRANANGTDDIITEEISGPDIGTIV